MDEFDVDHDDEVATPEELEQHPAEPLDPDDEAFEALKAAF